MNVTEKQALALFSLVFAKDPERQRPNLTAFKARGVDASSRKQLEKLGLIECEKVGRGAQRVLLTEAGWAWAADHLTHALPRQSYQGTRVLEEVLQALAGFLRQRQVALAELASTPPSTPASPVVSGDLAARVRAASLALAGGQSSRRVRISDVRRSLDDVARDTLDRVLLDLQRQEKLVLYSIDDPTDIRPEDRRDAVMVAGTPRHILYLEA